MRLTKSKLEQFIQEALTEDDYGPPSDEDLEYLNRLPPEAAEEPSPLEEKNN